MTETVEADVIYLHITVGVTQRTQPAGTIAQTAPRRAARGRSDEFFFLNLHLENAGTSSESISDQLANIASETYYSTPGSVTAALNMAIRAVNQRLWDINRSASSALDLRGQMIAAVLRRHHLYLAMCGSAQAAVVRAGQVLRMKSQPGGSRPLGLTHVPQYRFDHLEAQPEDLIILCATPDHAWPDTLLVRLADQELPVVKDQLERSHRGDLTGLVARLTAPGQAIHDTSLDLEASTLSGTRPQPAPSPIRRVRPQPTPRARHVQQPTINLSLLLNAAGKALRWLIRSLGMLLSRLAPGLADPDQPSQFSTRTLAITAIVTPLIVVAIAAIVYTNIGKKQQLNAYLEQAQSAAAAAREISDLLQSRAGWDLTLNLLDQAEAYGKPRELIQLRQEAQLAIDALDKVTRLEYQPILSGGFGSSAQIHAMVATSTDLFALDQNLQRVWHTWTSGDGYEIDRDFQCLAGPGGIPGMGKPVDILIQSGLGPLGVESVVIIDEDGTLLYCAPDETPASGKLTAPDLGWGQIRAMEVGSGKLYVLDPKKNAIWIYDASGGIFSGSPELFFTEQTPDLSDALDIARVQDDLWILHEGGKLDRCTRYIDEAAEVKGYIRVECEYDIQFFDQPPGYWASEKIAEASFADIAYSPPPEPLIFILDAPNQSLLTFSMSLYFQGQYLPLQPFETQPTSFTLGPTNDIFIAIKNQIYYARP